MSSSNLSAAYWRGFRHGLPFLLVIVPFGVLFGVAGTEAGLNLAEVMGFSILVIAGASQFTAVQLMSDHAPVILVLLTSLAVNLRMAMYSASLAPHLGAASRWHKSLVAYFMVDQAYAMAIADYERAPEQSLAEKLAYYAGVCTPICPQWYVSTLAGAVLGAAIPAEFALDFAAPITFLAMLGPALRSFAHVAAAAVSVGVALALAFLPSGLGLLIAAVAAMGTGAQVELWMARGAAR
ncbi:branched-chain amino acid transporter AzlC [Rhodobacter xanthinilyticus]|uniref:Branched-chain amino acid transporter AzlC n=1 Tax=Rhodobacter xanthinilyticus TaxID=1850250 RepID=A0A1D9M992_9RHOB|nr:AzlC family ABC transporter permease [Rhodobacter xanthinilyticus]AOZ68378.1 branched-chain amino acid transporter AzlC [Rhodobacter xanthinilyticus]